MKFYLFNDGYLPPLQSAPLKKCEYALIHEAHADTPEEAMEKAEECFNQFIAEHSLQDHCFIQWQNGRLCPIPCFGDSRGDWLACFSGVFRRQKYMDKYMNDDRFFKQISTHI